MTINNLAPKYMVFDKAKNNYERAKITAILTQAEEAFKCSEYTKVINLVEDLLEQGIEDTEREAALRCLLSEALCELGRYEMAAKALSCYEMESVMLSEESQAKVALCLGESSSRLNQNPKAIAKLSEALRLFTILSNAEGVTRCYLYLTRVYTRINEYAIARDYLMRAFAKADSLANNLLSAQVFLLMGVLAHYEGNFALAKLNYNKGLTLIDGTRYYRWLGQLQMNLASTTLFEECGSGEEIINLYEKAIENFQRIDNLDLITLCYNDLCDALLRFGPWEKATQILSQTLELARKTNNTRIEGLLLITSGELNIRCGNFAAAKSLLTTAAKIIEHIDKGAFAHAKRLLGYCCDKVNMAMLKSFNTSLQVAVAVKEHTEIVFSQFALTEYYCARQDYKQAHNFLRQAQENMKHKSSPYMLGFAQRLNGRLEGIKELYSDAEQHIMASVSIFTSIGDRYEVGRSHMELAEVLAKSGSYDRAATQIKQAREIFTELGANLELEKAHAMQERIDCYITSHGAAAETNKPEKVSERTLLKRLTQASITSELLLQEFSAIAFEIFNLRRLIIFQPGTPPTLFLASGCRAEEALNHIAALDLRIAENGRRSANSMLIKISCENLADTYFCLDKSRDGFTQDQMECIDLLLDIVRIGLEKSVLQSRVHVETVASTTPSLVRTPKTLIEGFVYVSPAMHHIAEQIRKIRTSNVTVLITGESGTGKELVARAIHSESALREGPFIAFNCTATPRELIESQLFGHKRGAFTGATNNYQGLIRAAKGGTLFLDEIGDLSLEAQPKLLRFLEAGEIQPLGEDRPLKVDVRVIAATNADLAQAVAERRFREDLYHRLNIIHIHIPPLRERAEEIPMLVDHYQQLFSTRYGGKRLLFSEVAMDALEHYRWPGNVRQLRNEIERLFAYHSDNDTISINDLSHDICYSNKPQIVPTTAKPPVLTVVEPERNSKATGGNAHNLREFMRPVERDLILSALERNNWNITHTAQELGMSRRGLRLKIKRLGL
ncbi:MAG: sigma 54-interacting transcriptional regulator [Acidobacteriota bacterium]